MTNLELCFAPATEVAALMASGQASAVEVLTAQLDQIEKVNPMVNAMVTVDAEGAMERARQADTARIKGESLGVLHGLTLGIKDLVLTKGMRTTFGSPIYRDYVPDGDHLIAEREKRAGAVLLGKTNTPEFGAGAQTFNPVFGVTCNPYDLSKTCGGSSGGSAVALACGMLSLADGSDFGGSLRAPAAWCNVVGLRPSPGRVPVYPTRFPWNTLSVQGPMGRTVADIALFLRAIAGPDPRDPISIEQSPALFAAPLERDFKGVRVAWSKNLGYLPVDPRVTAVCERQRQVFIDLGCEVEEVHPDFEVVVSVYLEQEDFIADLMSGLPAGKMQMIQLVSSFSA